jgi:hypothetical protein
VRIAAAALALAMALGSSGCGTLADAKAARGTGEARIYDVPANAVWSALPSVLKEAGLDYVGDNRTEGYALAQRGVTALSYGENVAIFVQDMRPGPKTRVEVVSKKQVALNVLAPDWEKELLERLAQKLQIAAKTPALASLEDVDAVPLLNERGRQGYRDWLTRKMPRAFVIAENGAWQSAWGTCTKNPEDSCEPAQRALANCEKRGLKRCRLYAVDNRVVWAPD